MDVEVNITCRICLDNCGVSNIFTSKRTVNASKILCHMMMSALFSISICRDDGLPQNICRRCYSKVHSAYKLKKLAEKSHNTLLSGAVRNDSACFPGYGTLELSVDIKNEFLVNLKEENEGTLEEWAEPLKVEEEWVAEESRGEDTEQTVEIHEKSTHDDSDDDTPLMALESLKGVSTKESNSNKDDEDTLIVKKKIILSKKWNPVRKKIMESNGNEKIKRRRRKTILTVEQKKSLKVCDLCGAVVKNLRIHMARHDTQRKRIPCGDCPRTFMNSASLGKHRRITHLGVRYHCAICKKDYRSLYEHIRFKHSDKPKPFVCAVCDRTFYTAALLKDHLIVHTDEKPFPCLACGKAFRAKAFLNYHRRRVHEGEKTHICQYCSKGFFSAHPLEVHLRCHTKEKNYKCQECEKAFASSSGLRNHIRRHEGLRPAQCPHCIKAFVNKGALTTHLLSHTKEKKHACKYCGVKFGRTDHRNRHQRTAHENKVAA